MTNEEIKNISDLQKLVDSVHEVATLARKIEIIIEKMTVKVTFKTK